MVAGGVRVAWWETKVLLLGWAIWSVRADWLGGVNEGEAGADGHLLSWILVGDRMIFFSKFLKTYLHI